MLTGTSPVTFWRSSMVRERLRHGSPGLLVLPFVLVAILVPISLWIIGGVTIQSGNRAGAWFLVGAVLSLIAWIVSLRGFFKVGPNEAKVMQLFGAYAGTAKEPGLRW